ncbi:pyridoxal-dependent decarboxylase [Aspergillus avenaceus]|uniref:Pyridoxal-dependent decarboxylase n=1 Tax=Aspergillus avenaceus TaxID=36643 RepID=A0A5N6U183_ASPAV|nr:pyridoxal-dependent decarboxylase [Aspergillus avenaceus]
MDPTMPNLYGEISEFAERYYHIAKTGPILNHPSKKRLSTIENNTPPKAGRLIRDVIQEAEEILSYQLSTGHPRNFAFIPTPVSPVSWMGDAITSAYNPFGGSSVSGAGVCAVERSLIAWIAERFGLPPSAGGQFVSGASMACLTACTVARDQRLNDHTRCKGVAYVSEETHFCTRKALHIIGLLDYQIRTIRCDAAFHMNVDHLRQAITEDLEKGLSPFLVVATCGTTSTGAIDHLDQIADIARRHKLWLHVDAAYGGSVAFSSTHRKLLNGIERADSIAWDAHKWLFQTFSCGTILFREKSHALKSFASTANFCRDIEDEEDPHNPWNYGIELTRPARHMKLWFFLQVLGMNRVDQMIGRGFELLDLAVRELNKLPHWVVMAPPSLAIFNFRFAPENVNQGNLDKINERVSKELIARNAACIITTRVRGVVGLRMCTINPRTSDEDICRVVKELDHAAHAVYKDFRAAETGMTKDAGKV